ncbi:MAG: hypothetical protein AAGH15_11005 [Myxococcota bacterium]
MATTTQVNEGELGALRLQTIRDAGISASAYRSQLLREAAETTDMGERTRLRALADTLGETLQRRVRETEALERTLLVGERAYQVGRLTKLDDVHGGYTALVCEAQEALEAVALDDDLSAVVAREYVRGRESVEVAR